MTNRTRLILVLALILVEIALFSVLFLSPKRNGDLIQMIDNNTFCLRSYTVTYYPFLTDTRLKELDKTRCYDTNYKAQKHV